MSEIPRLQQLSAGLFHDFRKQSPAARVHLLSILIDEVAGLGGRSEVVALQHLRLKLSIYRCFWFRTLHPFSLLEIRDEPPH